MYNLSMSRKAQEIVLASEELASINSWLKSGTTEQRTAFRSKIILAASEGRENQYIAKALHTTVTTVGKWRRRFIEADSEVY